MNIETIQHLLNLTIAQISLIIALTVIFLLSIKSKIHIFQRSLIGLLVIGLLSSCSTSKNLTLMPTPVIYQKGHIDPFAHMPEEHKSNRTNVFYATNRSPRFSKGKMGYGNGLDSSLHLGEATILMGEPDTHWDELLASSLDETQLVPVPLNLEIVSETAQMPVTTIRPDSNLTTDQKKFTNAINMELDKAVDKEIMIYIHGTNLDFTHSAILTAEIDYFAGRDFVSLAFSWPSHQNILYYFSGIDVKRAVHSSSALTNLLILLAEHTKAEHINILAYSAGGKLTSKALIELRQAYPDLNSDEIRSKFRIASTVFAAIDVEVDKFLGRLPIISELADQVVITVTDDDYALKAAKRFMGGDVRTGTVDAEIMEEAFIVKNNLTNVEIIDVSLGQEVRGFDITGHHYWYRHPWMSSDIVFLMRTDLPPHRRGLSPTELEGIWYLSPDYPKKVQQAAKEELKGKW